MCGICGFTGRDEPLLKKMADAITHRGPDREGFFVSDDVSMASRRLKIIDLSARGDQPIYNEDRTAAVVYNGEIYNFPKIKKELELKGHRFYSRTDTEVIVHAYEEYGTDCLHRFNGMFGFALWDKKEKALFIARDRVGIKPLYYFTDGKRLVFGSEIKSILEDKYIRREVNPQALYYYLSYEFVPGPMTMFKNIYKLMPGHYLIYKNGKIETKMYWDLKFGKGTKDKGLCAEGLREQLDRSVKRRLISDVPLGVFLSGGLDSTAVLAFMRRYIKGPLKAFSIGYADKTYSELDYAKYAAEYFGADHKILMIDTIQPDLIEKSLWHLDEPMTDLSTIPFYLICRKAREDVIVALSGEGGDEAFVGYDRFKASKFYNMLYRHIPPLLRTGIAAPLISALPDRPQKKGIINIAKRFAEGAGLPEEGLHMRWQYFSNRQIEDNLYLKGFKKQIDIDGFRPIRETMRRCVSGRRLDREIYLDARFTMPDSVLMKVDKMSMAVSLEVRVPFLDHEVLEFAAGIPPGIKFRGFTTKTIFRDAVRGLLPEKIVNRGKQGYSFPSKNWLRNELKEYMKELLNNTGIMKENMNITFINRLIAQHSAMTHNHNHILWALINLSVWYNRFFA